MLQARLFCIKDRHLQILKVVFNAILIIFIILIFPIFINVKFHYSLQEKKMFYYINLFSFINLLSGYVERIEEGFAVHVTKNKAIIIEYSSLLTFRKKVKPLKDYHFVKFYTDIQIGTNDSAFFPFTVSFLVQMIQNFFSWFFYHKKPQLKTETNVFLIEGENRLEIFCKVVVVLNLLMMLISLIKILTEKIIYANRNRKQQN